MRSIAHITGVTTLNRWGFAIVVATALFLVTSIFGSPVYAAAPPQPTLPDILVTNVEVKDTKDNIRDLFESAEPVMIEVEITDTRFLVNVSDDDPNISRDYIVVMNLDGPKNIPIYDSLEEEESIEVSSLPEERQVVAFRWKIPLMAEQGDYDIVISIRELDEPTVIIDDNDADFFVEVTAKLFVSDFLVDFGEIIEDETPSESIVIANIGDGILVWRVTEYPDDWLDLVRPGLNQTQLDTGRITLKVLKTALLGDFRGELVIESNAGDRDITIKASIDRNPRGNFTRIRSQDNSVRPGELLDFVFRIENEGDVDIDYRAVFSILDPTTSVVYNSNIAGEDLRIHVGSGDVSDNTTFTWAVPFGSLPGEYTIIAKLRNFHEWEMQFDEVSESEGDVFDVERGPLISASPGSWGFGTVISGNTPSAGFNILDVGRGTIEWEITDWPTWVEVVSPKGPVLGEGTIQISIRSDTPAESLAGTLTIDSNAGPLSIAISAHVLPPPTPTISVATVLALVATPTPSPTNTPRPTITPSVKITTPTPARPAIFDGAISIDGGALSESARLVAVIRDYQTFPALIQDRRYINLVISPPDESYVGEEVIFLLDGVPSVPLLSPVHFLPGQDRSINLIFPADSTPAITRGLIRATSTALVPDPPAVAVLLTVTPRPPSPTAVPDVSSAPAAVVEAHVTTTEDTDGDVNQPSAGGCSRTTQISIGAALGNVLLLLGPLGLIAALKTRRRTRGLN